MGTSTRLTALVTTLADVKISRRAALALVGSPVLVSCSGPIDFTPTAHRTAEEVTGTVPPEIEVESSFFARATDGRHVDVAGAAPSGLVFSTPHLDGRIGHIYMGQTLPYDVASRVERLNPLRAPDGHRFVAFTAQAGTPAFPETADHPVSVFLNVNGTSLPLRNMFGGYTRGAYGIAWEFIIACIPDDGTLLLEVTDEGKTVKIDLVQGVPAVDEAWSANDGFRNRQTVGFTPSDGVFERNFTTSPPAEIEAQTGLFRIGFRPNNAFLAPWNPVHGWAPQGKQWLTIPMNAKVEFEEVLANIELDMPGSFSYTSQAGETMPLVTPQTVTTETVRRQQADIIPTFEVTGRDTQASIVFNANGRAVVDYKEIQGVPAEFSSGATPLRFDVIYADAPERFGAK